MVGLTGSGQLGCRGIPSPTQVGRAWCVPATTRRVQAVSRPRRGLRGSRRSRTRVEPYPSCSRRLGEATDLTVAQAVIDERKDLAGDRDRRFVLPAPFGDAVPVGSEFPAPVIADRSFDD